MVRQLIDITRPAPPVPAQRRRTAAIAVGWLLSCLALVALYCAVVRPDLRLWRGTLTRGGAAGRQAALTFDDGPHPLWAPLLADTLERHGARGSFFVVGMEAQVYPELIARLRGGGHQVANHSLSHPYPNLTRLPRERLVEEIVTGASLLAQLTGEPAADFRPPGGGVNNAVIATLKARGMRMVGWSANIGDADLRRPPSPARIAERLRRSLRPGAVVLLHQREATVAALEQAFAAGFPEPYAFVTVASMGQQEHTAW